MMVRGSFCPNTDCSWDVFRLRYGKVLTLTYLQTVTFNKLYAYTALRLSLRGTMRGGYSSTSWWRFYINNDLWSNPTNIEHVNYNAESDVDHHKATGSECRVGPIAIDLPLLVCSK